jgi:hypothetical protein
VFQLAIEELSRILEEDLLPVVDFGHSDVVLPTNLRNRQPITEVGSEDGDLLRAGIIALFL